jgi:S-DNA-T family DNA segregation ATPase FtsK/SpoIIIE
MIAELTSLLADREARFQALGVTSMADFRSWATAAGEAAERVADVFLVIDGWASFRGEFEELETHVLTLTQRGLSFGIHVVVSAGRWSDVRPAMKDSMTTRYELRLGDPADSDVSRRAAADVPTRCPGRGLTADGLHFLAALPRVDGSPTTHDLGSAAATIGDRLRTAWRGTSAPPVRLLPRLLPRSALPTPAADESRRGIPIGIGEPNLEAVYLDFRAEPHLIVLGDTECGKTAALRMLATQIAARHGPRDARFLVVDYRRTLLGAIPDDHLAGYASGAAAAATFIAEAVTLLTNRLPGPDVTADSLRERTWWSGPDLFVLVDDYELLQSPVGNPLAALFELLPLARDVGLHLVVCRRVGGASRTAYEPVMQRLRELGTPGIVMSGSREEGQVFGGVRPVPQPPGRGLLVSPRHGQRLVQLAWQP